MSEWKGSLKTPSGVVETVVVATFREIISVRIISQDFAFNPALSPDFIRAAVEVNDPERFLPQPWPPVDTSTDIGLRVATLLKMKCILTVRNGLRFATVSEIQARLLKDFPSMLPEMQTAAHTRINATASLLETGGIVHQFSHPKVGSLPIDGAVEDGRTIIEYVKLMMAFGLTLELDAARS